MFVFGGWLRSPLVLISVLLGTVLCSELQQQLEKHSWIPLLHIWASN